MCACVTSTNLLLISAVPIMNNMAVISLLLFLQISLVPMTIMILKVLTFYLV